MTRVLAVVVGLVAVLEVDRRRTADTLVSSLLDEAAFSVLRRKLYDDLREFGGQS